MEADTIVSSTKKLKKRYHRHPQAFINSLREKHFNPRYSINDKKHNYEALIDPYASYYFSSPSVKDHLKKYRRAIRKQEPNQSQKKTLKRIITLRINESLGDNLPSNGLVYSKELTSLELQTINKTSSHSLHKSSQKSLTSKKSNENLNPHGFSLKKKGGNSTFNHDLIPVSNTEYPKIKASEQQTQKQQIQVKKEKHPIRTPRINSRLEKTHREKTSNFSESVEQSCDEEGKKKVNLKSTSKDLNEQKARSNKLADELHRMKRQKWLLFLQQKKKMLSKLRQVDNNPQVDRKA